MISKKAKIEALTKKIEERKALIKKHRDAGKAKNSGVVRIDRRLLKKFIRLRKKLVLGRTLSKKHKKGESAPAAAPAPQKKK